MLTPEQTTELKLRLQADLNRLADHAHSALDFTMDRDRDRIGRDSMDEATEEETYSTQLRLHDRETFLLGKIREAMVRLEAGEIEEGEGAPGGGRNGRVRGMQRADRVQAPARAAGHHAVLRVQDRARTGRGRR